MRAGFVKLRRGILEHLEGGRITLDEYAVYSIVIMNAGYRTGYWQGCALALSKQIHRSERWCQYKLAALRDKGYITATPSVGRGQYRIYVNKYFPEGAPGVTFRPKKAHPRSPLEEVTQEQSPLPPFKGGTYILYWCNETIAVQMGRKKRLPKLDAYHGARASDVVAFLQRQGFAAEIVRVQ